MLDRCYQEYRLATDSAVWCLALTIVSQDLFYEYKMLQIRHNAIVSSLNNELENRHSWQRKAIKEKQEHQHLCHLLVSLHLTGLYVQNCLQDVNGRIQDQSAWY